jgi:UDP-GlcNAc:undecaprenyl-phosphate GlcNAc-1-phosphate transferase
MVDKTIPVSYLLTSSMVLFIMGLKDDLSGVNSSTKFLIQFFVAAILVILGDIRFTSMYGIFGVYDISYVVSAIISILFIMLIVNAFNLIDGIDGLAGTTCIVVNGTFTILFIYMKHYELAAISLTIVARYLAFYGITLRLQKYLWAIQARCYRLISAIMAVKFIEANKFTGNSSPVIFSAPALTLPY